MSVATESPIKIISTKETCSDLCEFKYDYGLSDLSVMNNGDALRLYYNSQNEKLTFNDENLTVQQVFLYPKPLNTYQGNQPDAELHIYMSGSIKSNVIHIIPLKATSSKSKSVSFFNLLLNNVSDVEGERNNVPISNFNLNDLTPSAPYYYYYGTDPSPKSTNNTKYHILISDFVNSGFEYIGSEELKKIRSLLRLPEFDVNNIKSKDLFYNKVGTLMNDSDGSDDIYIDCQLVDESGEVVVDKDRTGSPVQNYTSNVFKNFKKYGLPTLLSIVFLVLIYFFVKMVYSYVYKQELTFFPSITTAMVPTKGTIADLSTPSLPSAV